MSFSFFKVFFRVFSAIGIYSLVISDVILHRDSRIPAAD
jgi:hypothetical protein